MIKKQNLANISGTSPLPTKAESPANPKRLHTLQDPLNRSIALQTNPQTPFSSSRSLARFHLQQAQSYLASGHAQSALIELKETQILSRSESTEFQQEILPLLLHTTLETGHLLAQEKDLVNALSAYDLAYTFALQEEPLSTLLLAQICLNRGLVYQRLSLLDQALVDFNQAVSHLVTLASSDTEQISLLAQALRNRGELQESLSQTDAAVKDFAQAIAAQNELQYPPDLQELAVTTRKLALLYQHQERFLEAESYFAQSLVYYRELYQKGHTEFLQDLVSTLLNHSQICLKLEKLEAAHADCTEALQFLENGALPAREKQLLQARAGTARGLLAWKMGDPDQSRNDFIASLYFYQALEAFDLNFIPERIQLHLHLAHLWLEIEDQASSQALAHYHLALEELQNQSQTSDPELKMQILLERGNLYREWGQSDATQEDYQRAVEVFHSLTAAKRTPLLATLAQVHLQWGLLLTETGAAEAAIKQFSQGLQSCKALQPREEVNPDHLWIQLHYFRGFCLAIELNQPEVALEDFIQIEKYCPGYASYDLACLYTRLGQNEKAIAALTQHVSSGYRLEKKEIEADPDLKPLKKLPAWKALLKGAF
ncbi:hypothetical protein COW36_19500 [bacterium (Candidatus Blackallbacteria) CG17_big_fil_post_rev_8_21_14_2_50_48_46]|uniref:MalT-like TPR region domain-containing protein n=1 Tax=bacterium (Candidatus Blackallbacteria) CG17_big_fil_post_rev_8_21_14_2_50_48_46 TaxID=2014261 RepID=A0A2M7FZJ9_9BACT|nr:MAG: hypothetical protein COW64_15795 [bacterium (Candidatus Blackallbacteria) CG18_big_fil_WC_8_21_14_2_50_49_26]PIW14838.1 MAG: hypothetical protein COW36_19500 [bacterium (Candidatus Blackallbacteria) CG17_big_fil_post_rev_8_21_14_2_50_48_46]PIW44405.1 MAG: hypothetical protein COW20_24075 [bacterium (Candidatus Blackallbacteria) CG13_big_fil_rev_8_21_14_2_50_49_14]